MATNPGAGTTFRPGRFAQEEKEDPWMGRVYLRTKGD